MKSYPDIIVLFSGGLDSILAAKILEKQGLSVRCLHCTSPFFGEPGAVDSWKALYGLDVVVRDVGEDFAAMLRARPAHGFGKALNPCVDCKILLLRTARHYMEEQGARALATGEVLGQRPMSQRRDALHLIMREAGVGDVLLRPLCALHLPPTAVEQSGLVDRSRLLDIWGRGRSAQLELAREYGLADIPAPGGGCRLTERENACRYWQVLTRLSRPHSGDFALANMGRQFWHCANDAHYWLCVGRNSADNERLARAAGPEDALLRLRDMPGPLALARGGALWPGEILRSAAGMAASYAPRAVAAGTVHVHMRRGEEVEDAEVLPARRSDIWGEPAWEEVRSQIRAEARERAARAGRK